MKYFYEDNGWQSTERWFVFRSKCSIFGTKTWCINDCPLEDKHEHPTLCDIHKTRYGFKEIFGVLKTKKGLATIGLTLLTIKVVINLTVNVSWDYEEHEGVFNNKTAKFRIAILSQENKWKFESSDSIETGLVTKELPELLDDLKGFDNMIGLIGVGAASQEGNRDQEVLRADNRADKIVSVLRNEVEGGKELYKLNLGQYLLSEPTATVDETSPQRRLIIIGIKFKENSMRFEELKEALRDALQKSSLKYTVRTRSYSNFDFTPMR